MSQIFEPCQSYQPSKQICADGFPQRAICSGRAGCLICDSLHKTSLPHCLSDELPTHWLNDDGSIVFYRLRSALSRGSNPNG